MRLLYLAFFFIVFSPILICQKELIAMNRNGIAEFPFVYINNFIIIDVVFDERPPLKFIFDTGAENTILTRRKITDQLNVDYTRKITLFGADLETELYAYVAPGIDIKLGDDLTIAQQAILVLAEDYFRFEEYTGIEIHGILGADILRRFIVSIDYRQRKITFQDPSTFKTPRAANFTKISSQFNRYKPYIYLPVALRGNESTEQKFLFDTGASLALLMYTATDSIDLLPETLIRSNIGFGLGGSLEGYVGRTAKVTIGKHELHNVITNFQNISEEYVVDTSFLNNRNGLIGNVILQRFNIIIDYIREDIYLDPNRDFKKKFLFDRSGISIAASGPQLNHFIVLNVIKDSPADLVGVKVGDEIRAINGVPVFFKSMESIIRIFQKKVGKKMQILIKRGEERLVVEFRLRDLI